MTDEPNTAARPQRRILLRYWLFQLPGTALVILALLLLREFFALPGWVIAAATAGWIVKDAVLYPFLKHVFDPEGGGRHHSPVGRSAIARERLAPSGYVALGGEVWRARLVEGAEPIPAGDRVRVVGVRGLTLTVEPEAR